MSGNLKALGLALLAALALSAVAAGPASAEESGTGEELFHAANHETQEPVEHFLVDAEAEGTQLIGIGEIGKITCANVKLHGTVFTESGTTNTIRVDPTYEECSVSGESGEFAAHVEFEECRYDLTSRKVEGHVPLHIICPENQEIHLKATFLGFKIQCMTFPEQTPTEDGVTYINGKTPSGETSFDDITIEMTVKGIEYTTHQNCGGEGEPYETRNDGRYDGNITMWGTDTEENKVDIWWD